MLTAEQLRSVVSYDKETGAFTWINTYRRRVKSNGRIGTIAQGYMRVLVMKRHYLAHRLAWLYVYGEWPSQFIDHINGNKLDNRISNLRDVSRAINNQNIRKPTSRNSTGYIGVCKSSRGEMFDAIVSINNKTTHIGRFATAEAAHEAYLLAKRAIHKGCTI